jgi:arylsulfatase A-like enzyme
MTAGARAASLLVVFVFAKIAILCGHSVPVSFWSPVAYLWQDLLIALLFGLIFGLIWGLIERRRPGSRLAGRICAVTYWLLVIYAAINIPLARAVSTPLTWAMLRAARGPLTDSVLRYVTVLNCALVLVALVIAAALPLLAARLPRRLFPPAALVALTLVAIGQVATARLDTLGLERNPVVAMVSTGLLQRATLAAAPVTAIRTSPFGGEAAEDLSALRGSADGRNVILISLESTAAQYLALYGSPVETMPRLSGLARDAVIFDNAYAVYPESIKGLFSTLGSIYPAFKSQPESYESNRCRYLSSVLSESGYRTGLFHSGRFEYLGMESVIRNRGFQTLEDAGDIGGNHNSSFGVDEPATVDRILSWVDALPRGQRFFVTYLPIAGHHPYETPERGPFGDTEDIDRYRNALHYGDISLGTLVDGIRERGLEDRTLWIIYGDHGEAFGQHEGNYGHTFALFDENVHVPLMIAAPGSRDGQMRVRKVVSLVDAAPTVLDLLGLQVPKGYQGESMLDDKRRMALFFTDYSLGRVGLRDERWKCIYEIESGRTRLFDLAKDPGEKIDVSSSERERASRYAQILRRFVGAEPGDRLKIH